MPRTYSEFANIGEMRQRGSPHLFNAAERSLKSGSDVKKCNLKFNSFAANL